MARIRVVYSGVNEANRILSAAIREMAQIEDELQRLEREVSPEIQTRRQVASLLRKSREESEMIHSRSQRLLAAVEAGLHGYRKTETKLIRAVPEHDDITI